MHSVFYLVRHGRTSYNNPHHELLRGWTDVPLSEQGREDARVAARYLRSVGLTGIISSNLDRTRHTADIIAKAVHIPNIAESRALRDWNMGMMEGKLASAMEPFLVFYSKHPNMTIPEGESYNSYVKRFKRALKGLEDFAKQFPESRVAVVTHNKNIVIAGHLAAGKDIFGKLDYKSHGVPNGSVVRVSIDGDRINLTVVHRGNE
jgi:broad specificity phosphatase PhoE